MIFTPFPGSCGYAAVPTGTIAVLLRVVTHRNHNSSYFSLGLFFIAPGSFTYFTVDITELCGDKEAEKKNNNRPIDPHFTNLGGMGEIHLQGWNRPADWPTIGFVLGNSGNAAEGLDCCHFRVRMFLPLIYI